eukprot:TRINITY_DN41727_c0_g1_i1.p1 TRINITY_DN41727_c0_g1~~TRINITY_DN41727_c0_g1_i1.p1  ORF type:complete len:326 (-),score=17.80 TRINITY_DN41727_c0_g1_i1:284-1261(-)
MLVDELMQCVLLYRQRENAAHSQRSATSRSVLQSDCVISNDDGDVGFCPSRASTSLSSTPRLVMYEQDGRQIPPQRAGFIRFVAISDTHSQHDCLPVLPEGDVLLHLGDFSNSGTLDECRSFCEYVRGQSFRHRLLVPGNHDLTCDREWYKENWQHWHDTYQDPAEVAAMLESAGVVVFDTAGSLEICGIRLFASPLQPRQPKTRTQMAFGRTRGAELKVAWAGVPSGADIVATHTPPAGILDASVHNGDKSIGCEELKKAVFRSQPLVHIFGHVHAGYGVYKTKRTSFINASSARERRGSGGHMNRPVVFDIARRQLGEGSVGS